MRLKKTENKARQWRDYFDRKTDALSGDARSMVEKARDAFGEVMLSAENEIEDKTTPWLVASISGCICFLLGVVVTVWVL